MNKKHTFLLVSILFILSGIAGLIYQVTWFKQLSYFIGNSTYAQSILLATFMGGLAVGSWYWGKKADTSKNTLQIFGILEILIAVYCYFYEPIFDFLNYLFTEFVMINELSTDSTTVFIARLVVSCLAILPPTILMGGTLPILVRHFSVKINEVGRNISVLYFLNSLGAVVGTVLAGFFLLESLGLRGTTFTGATLDLIVGVCSLLLAKRIIKSEQVDQKIIQPQVNTIDNKQYKIILLIAGVSGFCAMGYEIIWLRLLIPVLSSSTYSFTIILASFITGITIGSYLIYKYGARLKRPFLFLGICQLAIVLSIQIFMPFYERLPYLIWSSVGSPGFDETSYSYYIFIQSFYVFLLLFIPTIFMGMSLPLASKLVVRKINETGKTVGRVFAINTIGTVLGSLAVGLVLIPLIGITGSLSLLLIINVLLAVLVFSYKSSTSKRFKLVAGLFVLIATSVYGYTLSNNSWVYSIMLSEAPRKINRIDPPENFAEFLEKTKRHEKIHFYEEGPNGTFVVAENKGEIYLFTNGKGDANSSGDLRTQISLGLTPVILHDSPDSVFVIGFGAGTTIGHAMSHPRVKYGEVAEISKEVIDASSYFLNINNDPLSRKNLNLILDDGVSALRLSPHKFDVIISQPSNPWSAGVGNLFTAEFFNSCKEKLRPGGIVAQWFNLYEMDDKSLKLILRTVLSSFKHVELWHIGGNDILMICSETPLNKNLKDLQHNYDLSSEEFKKIKIHSFGAFLSQQFTSTEKNIKEYAGKGKLNTEDLPLLEHWAPKAYYYNSRPESFFPLDERANIESNQNLLISKYLQSNKATDDDILQAALFQSLGGNKELAFHLADMNPEAYSFWAEKARKMGDLKKAEEYEALARGTSGVNANSTPTIEIEVEQLTQQGKHNEAIKIIEQAIASDPNSATLYYQKGTMHLSLNQLTEAEKNFRKALELKDDMIDAYVNLAIVYGKQNKYPEVIALLDKAETYSTSNEKVYFNRGFAKALMSDFQGSIADLSKAIAIAPNYAQAYIIRGRAYLAVGDPKSCQDFRTAKLKGATDADIWIAQYCK